MKIENLVDRKLIKNIDLGIVISTILLIVYGMISISSATHIRSGGSMGTLKVQIIAFILGIIGVILILLIDYKTFGDNYVLIYITNVFLLTLVLIIGFSTKGTRGWIDLGPVNMQPSEVVKIGYILTFAKYLEKKKDNLNKLIDVLPAMLHLGLIVGLIMLQPDTGTALVFIFISIFMLFAAGISYKIIAGAFGSFLISLPIIWKLFLKPYQKNRILVFLNPELDPMGAGYHVIQSKTAIGSGQFLGKGLFEGTQNNLGFILERHTDFIFSVIGEELGLVGALVLMMLFLWLLLRCIHIAKVSKDDYGMLICVGIISMFLFHIFENIGMTIGLMPVTGIPLPFISYGGSNLLTNMAAVGLVLNVGMRRQVIRF
ncbi:MAG TPA: rod shape-determining protein RodA [Bacillota bacterium]|nr:rod shape-determining protein RodA [Bacillota bacterium]HQE67478.1 rod shape-determining protein RodA [Bacillota bacterium]HQI16599.1 rod shape-determining protein RodA [Bacillota bacterium]HQJ37439.1 rod shape-determining protein RodA [Bacillota bacterium]HQL36366.1 rod shape-determining protein RodA [Bacillota bacterium]